eukprot:4729343-Amphidinium_carterae.1
MPSLSFDLLCDIGAHMQIENSVQPKSLNQGRRDTLTSTELLKPCENARLGGTPKFLKVSKSAGVFATQTHCSNQTSPLGQRESSSKVIDPSLSGTLQPRSATPELDSLGLCLWPGASCIVGSIFGFQ